MREIKFKAFNKKTKRMSKPFLLSDFTIQCKPNGHHEDDYIGIDTEDDKGGRMEVIFDFDDFKFLQYIGLKDKRRRDVYDKDILYNPSNNHIYVIEYRRGTWEASTKLGHYNKESKKITYETGYYPSDFLDFLEYYIIVGNTHTTSKSELLKNIIHIS